MWSLFKIINFIWLLSSTYAWFTTSLPLTPLLFAVNVSMAICISFLPVDIRINRTVGRVLLAISAMVLWSVWTDGYVMGIYTFMTYLPAVMLIMLPTEYLKDLLRFVTKWYSIMLAIGVAEYFIVLVAGLPSLGRFTHPTYEPFINYGFYIKTTFDTGFVSRFNAFFLEPGHQALVSSFLLLANRYDFKANPFCYILLLGVIVSFSLAGYLLTAVGWSFLWINNIRRLAVVSLFLTSLVAFSLLWNAGDNDFNALIISRLEYDEEKGIKGNNRFYHNTDFEFDKAQKSGRSLTGVKGYSNMDLINGAGFKIYVLRYGWIGVILVALLYFSMIPPNSNRKYTATFLVVLALCFTQRSYPGWYSWLLPYILGTYTNRHLSFSEGSKLDGADTEGSGQGDLSDIA